MQLTSSNYLQKITKISSGEAFTQLSLEVFDYQYKNVYIYRDYCQLIGRTNPKELREIPFLPIEFFKNHDINAETKNFEALFKSSGTTNAQRAQHFVKDLSIYETVSKLAFESFFGPLTDFVIFALLPNYIEQGESSLIYMVNHLIKCSKNQNSGFYLNDLDTLLINIKLAKKQNKKVMLFGVSYALMDLAEQAVDLSDVYVIETGGMKGRRQEMPKEALHEFLRKGLNLDAIYSEYGMTELLSQAYCKNAQPFTTPPWMKVLIREANDPFTFLSENSLKSGGVSVIDLANLYSCAFIHTQDLGRYEGNGFQLLGRFDHSDIRGCNQLVWG